MKRKEEIKKQIEALENSMFYLWMKDYWTDSDRKYEAELSEEIRTLKKELAENA